MNLQLEGAWNVRVERLELKTQKRWKAWDQNVYPLKHFCGREGGTRPSPLPAELPSTRLLEGTAGGKKVLESARKRIKRNHFVKKTGGKPGGKKFLGSYVSWKGQGFLLWEKRQRAVGGRN